jgi:hypothetical protein
MSKKYYIGPDSNHYFVNPVDSVPKPHSYRDSKTGVFITSGTSTTAQQPYRTSTQRTVVRSYRLKRV